jgi:hypothetical protein
VDGLRQRECAATVPVIEVDTVKVVIGKDPPPARLHGLSHEAVEFRYGERLNFHAEKGKPPQVSAPRWIPGS